MRKRVKRSPTDWRALFAKQRRSGKTISEFCKAEHLNTNRFYSKRKLLGNQQERFIEIGAGIFGRHAPIVVEVGGTRVEVHDPATLREVLEALRGAAC